MSQFESPLEVSNLFWTPTTYKELEDWVMQAPKGKHRADVGMCLAFTMNMCAKAVDDAIIAQTTEEQFEEGHDLADHHAAMMYDMDTYL